MEPETKTKCVDMFSLTAAVVVSVFLAGTIYFIADFVLNMQRPMNAAEAAEFMSNGLFVFGICSLLFALDGMLSGSGGAFSVFLFAGIVFLTIRCIYWTNA